MVRVALVTALAAVVSHTAVALQIADVVTGYGLTESYTFAFPTQSIAGLDADNWVLDKWSVNPQHGISFGRDDISFVPDPSAPLTRRDATVPDLEERADIRAAKNDTPVLRIEYPQGSYSAGTGGTQFYAEPLQATSNSKNILPNTTSNGQFERMLFAYDLYLDDYFVFNKGGKLPGLRGGPDPIGCSGGHQATAFKCFSSRLMWRDGALGELYTYIPTSQKNFCSTLGVACNSDYGTSLGRGRYSLATGKWQTVWLYVALNAEGIANGVMEMYYNGNKVISFSNLEIRNSATIESIGGVYFSTFFGGYDQSWASPKQQFSYFRNMQLYAGLGAANGTGGRISGAMSAQPSHILPAVVACVAVALAGAMF
ncbi:hypothetical protein CcaverHIS002_0310610 [Cutaneotrichosporon cavernicola]|uniref:Polysaccharide lyase 14 domain-containing protein n=1 Tax=Cutaneotrichosporon cavernicola TaxID=279322 RepID=A0AA48QV40_9TREE|nr:uncharacterized protein CcaverHIS019_0310470 [Cutaneotrichosporon cavernicola]BEI83193.1 hypothetical protein CcaverHIS002_0310610 [Cutaneotrichosporon cavernicola]BEI90977.1 hypothetical protein CcaverHIS019_0310470 [Cutaneotrichosporon cavernicola]BEI98755.1 hypothetical protein CcaverHIS631_0310540 [Cutaneotrichosporon cavernicola]BEJ06527.1 hypothetical protein CcaverHIS641_0310490 [Cutaneotrichosporon cavernicola]